MQLMMYMGNINLNKTLKMKYHHGARMSNLNPSIPRSNLAGFWIRLVAGLIDYVIIYVCSSTLFKVMDLNQAGKSVDNQDMPHLVIVALSMIIFQFTYEAIFISSRLCSTPGKLMLGLIVTDLNGERISFQRAFGRYMAKLLSYLFLFVGFFMIAWTSNKQGLHDMLAETIVLKKR